MGILRQTMPSRTGRSGFAGAWLSAERRHIVAGAVVLAVLLLAVVTGVLFGARESFAGARDQTTLCRLHAEAPVATLAMLDVTDPLATDSGARFTNLLSTLRDDLPRDGRLTIVPFGGDLGKSLAPAFDGCSPGRGSQANGLTEGPSRVERDYQQNFVSKLNVVAGQLRAATPSESSPIAEQIERAVNDPAIGWTGTRRTLLLMTDGLEFTSASPIYRSGRIVLPPPPPGLLANVTVDYVELANPAHHALQTMAVREAWKAWFIAAGARKVNMYAPGYPRPSADADAL